MVLLFWQFQETLRLIQFSEKNSVKSYYYFFFSLGWNSDICLLSWESIITMTSDAGEKKEKKKNYTFWLGTGNAYALKEAWRVLHHSYFWWSFVGCKHLVQTRVPDLLWGSDSALPFSSYVILSSFLNLGIWERFSHQIMLGILKSLWETAI